MRGEFRVEVCRTVIKEEVKGICNRRHIYVALIFDLERQQETAGAVKSEQVEVKGT